MFEAVALGLVEFRRCALMDAAPGLATRFTVAVESPSTVHEVLKQKLTPWLEGDGKSPSEQSLKVRIRELLAT